MDSEFSGRVALVTGGASGIGRRVAEMLGERGARLALFDVNEQALKTVREDFAGRGWQVVTSVGDSSVVEDAEGFVRNAAEAYGRVDMLMNGAAIVVRKNLLDTTPEEWRRVIDVDLNGYFYIVRAAVAAMRKAGGGSIVQIASIAAHIGFGYPSYTAAKGAVLSLTRELAGELAPYRIRINSVSPGPTETGVNVDTMGDAKIKAALVATTPSGRVGKTDDIARAILFLLSPASEYINGSDLIVDGGMTSKIHFGAVGDTFQSYHSESRAKG